MTTEQIELRLRQMAAITHDDERAHASEAALRHEFIEYVASLSSTHPFLATKAALVLSSSSLPFRRGYE